VSSASDCFRLAACLPGYLAACLPACLATWLKALDTVFRWSPIGIDCCRKTSAELCFVCCASFRSKRSR